MAALDDLREYLGAEASAQWSNDDLTAVLAAESRAQLRVIIEPAVTVDLVTTPIPVEQWTASGYEDLYEALLRRCARNLDMRARPNDRQVAFSSFTRVFDAEVARLEEPHLRQVLG